MRDRTRAELARALAKRSVPPEVAEIVLDEFTQRGYLDDQRVAESAVNGVIYRPRSRSALQRELVQRGVDRELAREATEAIDRDAELDAARKLAGKRAAGLARVDRVTAHRRLAGALARRGFGSDVVQTVVRETLTQRAEDDDDSSGTFDL